VASEPEALLQVLTNNTYRFKRIGLEAGPLSQWLYSVLAEAGLPVICVETGHMRAMLKARINAGGALSTGAREDVTQPETGDAADPSQAASIEGNCHRERLIHPHWSGPTWRMSLTSRRTAMARKRYKPEEIVAKLRQVDVLVSQGQNMVDAIRQIGVSEVTYYQVAQKIVPPRLRIPWWKGPGTREYDFPEA
jgi:hypothetical protein